LHQAPPGMIQLLRAVPPLMATEVSSTLLKPLSCEWVLAVRGPEQLLVGSGLPEMACHVIQSTVNPRVLSQTAPSDLARIIWLGCFQSSNDHSASNIREALPPAAPVQHSAAGGAGEIRSQDETGGGAAGAGHRGREVAENTNSTVDDELPHPSCVCMCIWVGRFVLESAGILTIRTESNPSPNLPNFRIRLNAHT